MKKYQVVIKNKTFEIIQDDDGKFIIPEYIKKQEQFGTALKPSFEPVIVARKPFKGSLVDNVIEYGVGGINIDECRVGTNDKLSIHSSGNQGIYGGNSFFESKTTANTHTTEEQKLGRFPANTILTYDETDYDEVCGGFPISGQSNSTGQPYNYSGRVYDNADTSMFNGDKPQAPSNYNDVGSASRYFYCAKASKKDRDEGLEEFEEKNMRIEQNRGIHSAGCEYIENGKLKQNPHLQSSIKRNIHPTVKPTELMQYLVRLVTPKGGKILDPFMGSGSTGKAVMFENKERNAEYKFIGIEKEKEYYEIANARIKWAEEYKEETLDSMQISINEILEE